MTIDSVVQKTGIALLRGDRRRRGHLDHDAGDIRPAATDADIAPLIGAADCRHRSVAFGLSLVNSFKRVISPALVLAFARARGRGARRAEQVLRRRSFGDGIVIQAVIGTFAAFAGTLAAYKFFNIQVGSSSAPS